MATSPEKWETVKALFEAALELDSGARPTFLLENRLDPEARAEVERLLSEHDLAGSFLSTPVLGSLPPEPDLDNRLSAGDLLAGRFKIVRYIAGGGMGEVYEAEDLELHEHVAIKTIRPEILRQPSAVKLFKREVHLARKVTHSNVCRIFDLFRHKSEGSDEETVFVSMELLNGSTLSARLRAEGRLTTAEALPLVKQIASALYAAHGAGIVHRDLKPGNVVLVSHEGGEVGPRAVITDFGLAFQPVGADGSSLTTGPQFFGTPVYMAPEQIEGHPATVASDIYSFGLVMYEMVTGMRPFQGDTPISTAVKRLSEEPPTPRKFQPDLNLSWETTILRCLQRDPTKRFANTNELVRALDGEIASIPNSPRTLARQPRTWFIAALLVLTTIGIWNRFRIVASQPEIVRPNIQSRRSVAVLGFKNLSGKPELGWISTALAEELTSELGAGEKLRTIPGENIARMKNDLSLTEMESLGRETLSKIRQVLGTDLVVSGSYLDVDQKLRLDLRVQDAAAGETIATLTDTATEVEILDLVSRVGEALRTRCGAGEITSEQAETAKATQPHGAQASRLYAEGLDKLRLYDAVSARESLQRALAVDPDYAPAHTALAVAWSHLGYDAKSQAEARRAFDLAASLPREQRLNIEGRYYVSTSQWDKAIDIYHTLFSFFPDNLEYGLSLASAQQSGGKTKDALDSLQSLLTLPSPSRDDPRINLARSQSLESLGDYTTALEASTSAANKAGTLGSRLIQAQAKIAQCFDLSGLGKFSEAKLACKEAEEIYSGTGNLSGLSKALMNSGNLLTDKGDVEEAIGKYEKAILNYRQIGDKRDLAWALNNLGTALTDQRNYEGARKLHEQALTLFQETGQKRGQAASLNNMANVLEAEGNLRQASRDYAQAAAIQRELGDKRRVGLVIGNLARLLYLQGRLRESREASQQAASIHREAGSKQLYANALTQLASVDVAEAKLPQAQQILQEAQTVYTDIGQKWRTAECLVQLSRVLTEEDRLSEAEELSRKAIDGFRSQNDSEREGSAHLALAEVLLARAKLPAAQQEVAQAVSLSGKGVNRETRFELAITSARVDAAVGNFSEALRSLELTRSETVHYGYISHQFDTRLALGEIEMDSGNTRAGRAGLIALQKEAEAKGFALIAQKAKRAASD
jgi:serine/threonine protein kinase/tetratricopeptide (TPR) repeat protein